MLVVTALLAGLAFIAPVAAATRRGMAWAIRDDLAPKIADKPLMKWYHHWQDGPVQQMPSDLEYVPQFWGPKYWGKWEERLREMEKHTPAHLLSFNEPDIRSQSNMSPSYAAQLFMEQVHPWSKKGTLLGSPAIVWNLNWLAAFLSEIKKKGGSVDFVAVHVYVSWKHPEDLKTFVETVHHRTNKTIWITEVGVTASSNPTQDQVKKFMMDAIAWMDTQHYIRRVAWFGCWDMTNPPDDYASKNNAFFKHGELTDSAYWYAYTDPHTKRSTRDRHRVLSREDVDEQYDTPAVHCDEICQNRRAQLIEYHANINLSSSA